MPLTKQGTFTFNHSDQPNDLYNVETSTQIKSNFDSRAQEVANTMNAIIDQLKAITDTDSGADNIGATAITGLTGTTVQTLLEALKSLEDTNYNNIQGQLQGITLGQIPDGTITDIKLSDSAGQIKQSFATHNADNVRHITANERTSWNTTSTKTNDLEILYWMG